MANSLVTEVQIKNANAVNAINEVDDAAKKLGKTFDNTSKKSKQSARESAAAWKMFGDSLRPADTQIGKLQRKFASFAGGPVGKLADGLGMDVAGLAKFATVGGAAVAVGAAFAKVSSEAVQQSAQFGAKMSALSGITGVSGKALQDLRTQIQQLGKDSNTNASAVADNFAQIGSALPQLLKDTAGLGKVSKAAITLSKAGLMELGDATDSLTATMAQYNISADEAANVTDILANAAQLGSAGISEVASSLKVCGTAAGMAGVSLSQTASMVEVLASKGLKGAEAGTALRNVFTKMTTSGIDQMNPKIVGLSAALEFLKGKANDAQFMVKTFGAENMSAAAILAQNIPMYNDLAEGMERAGTAADMAQKNFDNLMGDWQKMGVAWDNLMSSFNVDGADNPLRGMVQEITNIINAVNDFFATCKSPEADGLFENIPLDPLRDLLGIITDLINHFTAMNAKGRETSSTMQAVSNAWQQFGLVVKVVRELLWWVETAILAVKKGWDNMLESIKTSVSVPQWMKDLKKWCDDLVESIKKLLDWYRKIKGEAAESTGRKKKKEAETESGKSGSSASTTTTTTTTTTTNTTKKKDPIAEAEKKYAKDIITISNERKANFIDEKTAAQNEVSAIESVLKAYYSQEKLTDKQNDRVKELTKALDKAKARVESMGDKEKYKTAMSENSKALSQASRQYADDYISEDEMQKIISEARDKLIKTLYELKSPTEEQSKLLKELIKTQNKEKIDKAATEISNIRTELEGELKDIMLDLPQANELYTEIHNSNSSRKGVFTKNLNSFGGVGKGDKSNFGLTNKSADRIEKENKLYQPKLPAIDYYINEMNKAFEKYSDRQEAINRANAETFKKGKESGMSDEQIQMQIVTHDEELDRLEKKIKKFKSKIDSQLKFEATIQGVENTIGSLSTIGNSIKTLSQGYENCESAVDYFLQTLSMVSAVVEGINAVMSIMNMLNSVFAGSQTASAVATEAVTAAETEKAVVDGSAVAPATANTAALKLEEAAYLDLAAAAIFAAHAAIPFAGVAIATGMISSMMAVMAATTAASAAMAAMANGGIVGGSSFSGDNQMIRVNSGEMILNTRQQSNLFDLLDSGGVGGGGVGVSTVKIKGSDIYLALSNYNKIQSKAGRGVKF